MPPKLRFSSDSSSTSNSHIPNKKGIDSFPMICISLIMSFLSFKTRIGIRSVNLHFQQAAIKSECGPIYECIEIHKCDLFYMEMLQSLKYYKLKSIKLVNLDCERCQFIACPKLAIFLLERYLNIDHMHIDFMNIQLAAHVLPLLKSITLGFNSSLGYIPRFVQYLTNVTELSTEHPKVLTYLPAKLPNIETLKIISIYESVSMDVILPKFPNLKKLELIIRERDTNCLVFLVEQNCPHLVDLKLTIMHMDSIVGAVQHIIIKPDIIKELHLCYPDLGDHQYHFGMIDEDIKVLTRFNNLNKLSIRSNDHHSRHTLHEVRIMNDRLYKIFGPSFEGIVIGTNGRSRSHAIRDLGDKEHSNFIQHSFGLIIDSLRLVDASTWCSVEHNTWNNSNIIKTMFGKFHLQLGTLTLCNSFKRIPYYWLRYAFLILKLIMQRYNIKYRCICKERNESMIQFEKRNPCCAVLLNMSTPVSEDTLFDNIDIDANDFQSESDF